MIGIGDTLADRIKRQVDPDHVPAKAPKTRKEAPPKMTEEPARQGQTRLLDF